MKTASAPKAKAITKPIVEWQRNGDFFQVFTLDAVAAKAVRAKFDPAWGCYVGQARSLPVADAVTYQEFKTEPTTPAFRARLLALFTRYSKMQAVIAKMGDELEREEAKIVAALKANGLRLKPGLLEDTQALAAKTRLHYCQSLYRYIDDEAVQRLMHKHPEIAKCVKTTTHEYLDEEALEEAVAKLPAYVSRAIYKVDVQTSMREITLKRPECVHCGGKINKQGVCKHCGLEEV